MNTALVTGGTGFIGSHTVEQLLAEGFRVKCLIRPHQINIKWLENLPVEMVKGDLSNSSSLLKCIESAEYIVHIAGVTKAKDKKDFFTGNVKSTQQLLYASSHFKHIKKFCFISSLTAVGPSASGVPLTERSHCHPITSYGESKLEAENICKQYMDRLPIVILRPPAVYGPRDPDILQMFKCVGFGFRPIIGSTGKTLSLVYVKDLAKGIVQSTMDERTSGEIYNISDPTIYQFSSIIDYLATFVNKRTIQIHLPRELVYSMAGITQFVSMLSNKPPVLSIDKARDLLQKHWVCDSQKIMTHIGFQTMMSVYDGIKNTFEWYKENGWL